MRSRRSPFAAAVIALLMLLPSSCWGVHRSHHTLPRESSDSSDGSDPHRGGTHHDDHELQPAIAPRGKHFSWHSSWQRGKKVTVLAIEPYALRDRRSVLRHNVTRHNVRHRHGSNNSNNNNSVHKQDDYRQEKAPDRLTFQLTSGNTNYNNDNEPAVAEVSLRGKPALGDFNTVRESHNNVNHDEVVGKDNLITPNENPYTRMKKHTSNKVLKFETKSKHSFRKDHKSNRASRFQMKRSGEDSKHILEQQKDMLSHDSREMNTFQKSANPRGKFDVNNNTGDHKIVPVSKESGKKYDERENDVRELEGELLEFLERRRRDNGARSVENKSERIRRRRVRRKSRVEKRRQRRRQRNQLRRRPANEAGGERRDSPVPAREQENRRRNGRRRSRERGPSNPAREERKRQRIAERRKRRRERRLRRKEKKRGRSLDVAITGLIQNNKSMLNGSNACQFRDLLRCTKETFALDTGPKPADTIPRCKQRKSFFTCMQQQRISRGDCSPSVKAVGDLQALRKYIREAMFTNSSCIIAESITG